MYYIFTGILYIVKLILGTTNEAKFCSTFESSPCEDDA